MDSSLENGDRKPVSPLRQRMIDDMKLAGFSPGTQENYIAAVVRLQKATCMRPDRLAEAEVRRYLIDMRNSVARGTFQANFYGLKFFFYCVLGYDWDLFIKKRWPCRDRSVFRLRYPLMTAAA
jgi:hypothetical protein